MCLSEQGNKNNLSIIPPGEERSVALFTLFYSISSQMFDFWENIFFSFKYFELELTVVAQLHNDYRFDGFSGKRIIYW